LRREGIVYWQVGDVGLLHKVLNTF